MKVQYVGHKKHMPVYLPIGAKTKGTIKQTLFANPFLELCEQDAKALVELAPAHFVLVPEVEAGLEIHEDKVTKKPAKAAKRNV